MVDRTILSSFNFPFHLLFFFFSSELLFVRPFMCAFHTLKRVSGKTLRIITTAASHLSIWLTKEFLRWWWRRNIKKECKYSHTIEDKLLFVVIFACIRQQFLHSREVTHMIMKILLADYVRDRTILIRLFFSLLLSPTLSFTFSVVVLVNWLQEFLMSSFGKHFKS